MMKFETRHSKFERARPRRAFTLIELLMAMFILAIGLVAIASIFPVAGTLQQAAADATTARDVHNSVTAMLEARGLDETDLGASTYQNVSPVPQNMLADRWPLATRCHPQALDLDMNGIPNETGEDENFTARQFYWVPLVRDKNATPADRDWQVFVFILRKAANTDYPSKNPTSDYANPDDPDSVPGVAKIDVNGTRGTNILVLDNLPDGDIQSGDQILDSNGVIYDVVTVDGDEVTIRGFIADRPDEVWYGKPAAGKSSPTRLIATFGSEVIQ